MNIIITDINNKIGATQTSKLWGGYTNANINKQRLNGQTYKLSNTMTQKDLQKNIMKSMKLEKGYNYMVTSIFKYGFRAGQMFNSENYNDKEIIYNIGKEYKEMIENEGKSLNENIQYFTLYKYKVNSNKGGDDYHNDCLYYALQRSVNVMPKEIKTRIKLKKFLGIERCEKICISDISKIEELFIKQQKTSINITGEYNYDSKHTDMSQNIQLCLKNEQYTIKNNENKNGFKIRPNYNVFFPKGKNKIEIYMYYNVEDDSNIIYNGEYRNISTKTLKQMERDDNIMFNSKNIRITKIKKMINNSDKLTYIKETIKQEYDEYLLLCDEMKEKTNGIVNIYKYRSIKYCALDFLRMKSKKVKNPEKISKQEAEYLNNSFFGGFQYYQEYEHLNAVCLDINSSYSNVMTRKFMIPICAPIFHYYEHTQKYFKFGVYRCKIINNTGKNLRYVVSEQNQRQHFTHIYLNTCINLGLDIEMIKDNEYNAMIYDESKLIKSNDLFGEYVNYFFNLKKEGVKSAKAFLNVLYGALAQKQKIFKTGNVNKQLDIDTEYIDLNHVYSISKDIDNPNIEPITMFEYIKKEFYYVLPYARISPFISANSYKLLTEQIIKIENPKDILRIHTDSITLSNSEQYLNKFKISDKVGDWKLEKQGNISIKGMNKFKWK